MSNDLTKHFDRMALGIEIQRLILAVAGEPILLCQKYDTPSGELKTLSLSLSDAMKADLVSDIDLLELRNLLTSAFSSNYAARQKLIEIKNRSEK